MTGDWHGEPASSPPATCAAVLLGDAKRRRDMGGRAVAEAARDGVRESESASLFFFLFRCVCVPPLAGAGKELADCMLLSGPGWAT